MDIGEIVKVGEREMPVFKPVVTPMKEDPTPQAPVEPTKVEPEKVPEKV